MATVKKKGTKRKELRYAESEGGAFILLPMEAKKDWRGHESDDGGPTDYDRVEKFGRASVCCRSAGPGR